MNVLKDIILSLNPCVQQSQVGRMRRRSGRETYQLNDLIEN